MNEELRQELLAMKAEDVRVRNELVVSGELGGTYVPRMEGVVEAQVPAKAPSRISAGVIASSKAPFYVG